MGEYSSQDGVSMQNIDATKLSRAMTEMGTQTKLYYERKEDRDPRIVGEIILDNRG